MINGQQTATATYPCPYCYVTYENLKNYDCGDAFEKESNLESTKLKTYGDLKKRF